METIVYSDTQQFWNEISPSLRKDEAKNSLILGLCDAFRTQPSLCLFQAALFNAEHFLGALVASEYKGFLNLLPSPLSNSEYAQKLFSTFQKKSLPIKNLIGEKSTVEIYQHVLEQKGYTLKINMRQGIYRCTQVSMPAIPESVSFRWAQEQDVDFIGSWIRDFHFEAVPHDPPFDFTELAASRIAKKMIYVAEVNGVPVSIAAWSRDIGTSNSVNLVFTPKQFRNRGYASMVTAMITKKCLDSGKLETNLYTDMSNPTSNKIYQKIGYSFVSDSLHMGVE